MRFAAIASVWLATPALAHVTLPLTPGPYTNEEEVYFAKEAGKASAPWTGITVDADGKTFRFVDAFGREVPSPCARPGAACHIHMVSADTMAVKLPDGTQTMLQRGRPVTCWGSVPKSAKKADGSDDWYYVPGLKLHDRGGRVAFGGDAVGTKPVVLRMRNVVWPSGPNKPSLVLYVHTPDNPDHAVSYSWADPDAKRIGINLRWMQASCTIDGK